MTHSHLTLQLQWVIWPPQAPTLVCTYPHADTRGFTKLKTIKCWVERWLRRQEHFPALAEDPGFAPDTHAAARGLRDFSSGGSDASLDLRGFLAHM